MLKLGDISMKKILSLALGLSFVFGTLAFAQDAGSNPDQSTTKSSKKHKKSKKNKSSDKMQGESK
jgi:hypothetical protein